MCWVPRVVAGLVQQNARRHLSHGVTSVGDAVVLEDSAEIYRLADERNKLPIVVHQMRGGNGFFAAPEAAAGGAFLKDDVSDRLRGGIVKIFMDPVWPTFAYTKCHADGTFEDMGEPYYGQDEVDHLVLNAASHGLQVAIHCLGDRAIEQALNNLRASSTREFLAVIPATGSSTCSSRRRGRWSGRRHWA